MTSRIGARRAAGAAARQQRERGRAGAGPSILLPTTPQFLHLQARRRGDAGGLVFRDQKIPYGRLAGAVDDLAAWLAARGIGAGQRVGVMAANEPAGVAATFALWGLGAASIPISVRATAGDAARMLARARAAAVICDTARVDVARAAVSSIRAFAVEPTLPLRPRLVRSHRGGVGARARAPRPHELAVLAYTSGTTGAPKGVMLSHANLWWSAMACGGARGDRADGVGVAVSPLTHTPVFVSHLLCRVLAGATTVLLDKFDVPALLESVERWGVTDLPLIGGMVFDVVARGGVPASVRRCVRKVTVGGAPTPMTAKDALRRIFDGAEIIEAYGQTESTDGVTMARGSSVFDRPTTVGSVNPHVVVAVRRPDGTLADPDEDGELVVAGPTVMTGYYRDRPATAAALRDGWLHTGDRGRRDGEGFFYVTGRVKDLIITGGENVSPIEVEEVLRTHPGVQDVAVIGTPHPKWGEQVTAVIVARAGADVDGETIVTFASTRLSGFKKPRRVEFVESLPRNAAKKVMTSVLKEQFARGKVG